MKSEKNLQKHEIFTKLSEKDALRANAAKRIE